MSARSSRRSTSNASTLNIATIQLLDRGRLVKELAERGLDTTGTKATLSDRLFEFVTTNGASAVSAPTNSTESTPAKAEKKTKAAKTPSTTPASKKGRRSVKVEVAESDEETDGDEPAPKSIKKEPAVEYKAVDEQPDLQLLAPKTRRSGAAKNPPIKKVKTEPEAVPEKAEKTEEQEDEVVVVKAKRGRPKKSLNVVVKSEPVDVPAETVETVEHNVENIEQPSSDVPVPEAEAVPAPTPDAAENKPETTNDSAVEQQKPKDDCLPKRSKRKRISIDFMDVDEMLDEMTPSPEPEPAPAGTNKDAEYVEENPVVVRKKEVEDSSRERKSSAEMVIEKTEKEKMRNGREAADGEAKMVKRQRISLHSESSDKAEAQTLSKKSRPSTSQMPKKKPVQATSWQLQWEKKLSEFKSQKSTPAPPSKPTTSHEKSEAQLKRKESGEQTAKKKEEPLEKVDSILTLMSSTLKPKVTDSGEAAARRSERADTSEVVRAKGGSDNLKDYSQNIIHKVSWEPKPSSSTPSSSSSSSVRTPQQYQQQSKPSPAAIIPPPPPPPRQKAMASSSLLPPPPPPPPPPPSAQLLPHHLQHHQQPQPVAAPVSGRRLSRFDQPPPEYIDRYMKMNKIYGGPSSSGPAPPKPMARASSSRDDSIPPPPPPRAAPKPVLDAASVPPPPPADLKTRIAELFNLDLLTNVKQEADEEKEKEEETTVVAQVVQHPVIRPLATVKIEPTELIPMPPPPPDLSKPSEVVTNSTNGFKAFVKEEPMDVESPHQMENEKSGDVEEDEFMIRETVVETAAKIGVVKKEVGAEPDEEKVVEEEKEKEQEEDEDEEEYDPFENTELEESTYTYVPTNANLEDHDITNIEVEEEEEDANAYDMPSSSQIDQMEEEVEYEDEENMDDEENPDEMEDVGDEEDDLDETENETGIENDNENDNDNDNDNDNENDGEKEAEGEGEDIIELKTNARDLLKMALPMLQSFSTTKKEEKTDQYCQIIDENETDDVVKIDEEGNPEDVYYHGDPVPEVDDNELFEIAAGIKPTKKKEKKSLVQIPEEEKLPSTDAIELDYYNASIHVKSAENDIWMIEPFAQDGLALMWGGVRSNFGIRIPFTKMERERSWKVGFQIEIESFPTIQHLPADFVTESDDVRVGFALGSTSHLLGESTGSWGISCTGKKVANNHFTESGTTFDIGDVITCILDFATFEISYLKNGELINAGFQQIAMHEGDLIYPAICVKNANVKVNFGQAVKKEAEDEEEFKWGIGIEQRDWMYMLEMNRSHLERSSVAPNAKSECTVLMTVGLPGVGKTTWVRRYLSDHPHEKWTIISADIVMEAMKINGVPRNRVTTLKRPDFLRGIIGKSMARLILLAPRRRKNYMIDMTNCLFEKRKRKLMAFEEFNRKCVVFVPDEDVHVKRLLKQEHEENEKLDTDALMMHKASMSLPSIENDPCEEVLFIDPPSPYEHLAIERVQRMNHECRSWVINPGNGRRGGRGGHHHHFRHHHQNSYGHNSSQYNSHNSYNQNLTISTSSYQHGSGHNSNLNTPAPMSSGANSEALGTFNNSPAFRMQMNITHTTFQSTNFPSENASSPVVPNDDVKPAVLKNAVVESSEPAEVVATPEPMLVIKTDLTKQTPLTSVKPRTSSFDTPPIAEPALQSPIPSIVVKKEPIPVSPMVLPSPSPKVVFPAAAEINMSIPPPTMVYQIPSIQPIQPIHMMQQVQHVQPIQMPQQPQPQQHYQPMYPCDVNIPPPNFSLPPPPLPHVMMMHQKNEQQHPQMYPAVNYPPPQFTPR